MAGNAPAKDLVVIAHRCRGVSKHRFWINVGVKHHRHRRSTHYSANRLKDDFLYGYTKSLGVENR